MHRILPLVLLLLFPLSLAAQEKCVDWPLVMRLQTLQQFHANHPVVLMKPFENGSRQTADDWLSEGIPWLLKRYLSTDRHLNLFSEVQRPYLKSFPEEYYRVEGLFQHIDQTLRIFVQLKDPKGKLVTQIPIKTPFLKHTHFFESLKEGASEILAQLGRKKPNASDLETIQNETRNIFAFSNVVKGMAALEKFEPNHIEVALIWFQEAFREDPKYPLPYLGMIDAYSFLYLDGKLAGGPYPQILENIHNTEKAMRKKRVRPYFDGQTEKERKKPGKHPAARNYVHFTAGKRAFDGGDFRKAAQELDRAFDALPEESLSAYYLGQSYAKLGHAKKAEELLRYAKEINRCLKD